MSSRRYWPYRLAARRVPGGALEWNGSLALYLYITFSVSVARFMSGGLSSLLDWGYHLVGDSDKLAFGFSSFHTGRVGGVAGAAAGCLFGLSANL